MKLVEMQVSQFVDVLASDAPAPGGGSAAALDGALGIALTNMVAELTIGKTKYQEFEPLAIEIKAKATALKNDFIIAIDKDTEAFNNISAVFGMPKDTDQQKAERKAAMQAALKICTESPYQIMELCLSALQLTKEAIGKTNTSASSDLGVAALNLKAAVQGAWLNVLINIGGINDQEFVKKYQDLGQKTLAEATATADYIYEEILKSL